jgi:type II secretory pathway pseudopilin PulG
LKGKFFIIKNMGRIDGKKYKVNKSGFSLVEILVVIMFIGIGLVGVLSFFSSSLRSNADAKNELIAAGLAQEGTELVRNIRDYNKLNGNSWYNNLFSNPTAGASLCDSVDYSSFDSSSPFFHKCYNGLGRTYVCLNGGGRYYQCTNGNLEKTDFSRTIGIVRNGDLNSGGSLSVTCTVTWNDRTTTAVDQLYSNSF